MSDAEKLSKLKKLLEKNNIKYWIDYGTLLGIIREGALLKWETDFDIGIYDYDVVKVLSLKNEFEKMGYKIEYIPGRDNVQLVSNDAIMIDFSIYHLIEGKSVRYFHYHKRNLLGRVLDVFLTKMFKIYEKFGCEMLMNSIDNKFFDNLETIKYESEKWPVPSDVEKYLASRFGETWRTPIKNYD
jgi:phosphorylcholine metabolism protein LicD